jgi:hypothetical protein
MDVLASGKRQSDSLDAEQKERQTSWVMPSGMRRILAGTAVATGIAGVAVMGAIIPANASPGTPVLSGVPIPLGPFSVKNDPGCDMFGWQHPMCAGGAFESPMDDGIPGDNAAEGGIPAPAMVPNIDGSLSPPGTPGAI